MPQLALIIKQENLGIQTSSGISPDGIWEWGRYERIGSPAWVTIVYEINGSKIYLLELPPRDLGLENNTQTSLTPFFWMPKDPYVYMAGNYCCVDGAFGYTGFNLLRLNLVTGEVREIVPGNSLTNRSFFFSPIGQFLIISSPMNRFFKIIHIRDGAETLSELPTNTFFSGDPFWSPDETFGLFRACRTNDQAPFSCESEPLFLVNPENGSYRLLVANTRDLGAAPDDFIEEALWINRIRVNLHMRSGLTWQLDLIHNGLVCQPGSEQDCP